VVAVLTDLAGAAGAALAVALARAARRSEVAGRTAALRPPPAVRPAPVAQAVERALAGAGIDLDLRTALAAWAGAAAAAAIAAGALSTALVLPGAAAGAAGPVLALAVLRGRWQRRVAAALPAAIEGVAGHLRAGATVREALAEAADRDTPLRADLHRLDARLRLGGTLPAALRAWVAERDVPGVRAAAGALATADELGGAAAEALDGLAASLRDRLAAVADARSHATQARWSAAVVTLAPVAYLAFAAATDRSAVSVLTTDPVGRGCLAAGSALLAAAALVMRRMTRERW
jgi:tight adherence protein B